MRVKIGTSIEERLLERAREAAHREGRALNEIIEQALAIYLGQAERVSDAPWSARTAGTYSLSPAQAESVLRDDIYDTD